MQQARHDPEPTLASEETMLALLKRVARDALDLVQNEFSLARAEGRETLAALKRTIAAMLIGAALLLAGGLTIVAGIVLIVSLWIPAWIAALGVGAVLLGIGLVVFARASNDASGRELDLPRTRESVSQDLAVLKRNPGKPA